MAKRHETEVEADTLSIRIDTELVRRVRIVAAALGTKPTNYIADKLRQAIDIDMPRVLKMLTENANT